MRIALDATYSIGSQLSGVGVYSQELLRGLAASHPEASFLHCYRFHAWRKAPQPSAPNVKSRLLAGPWPPADLFHGLNQRLDRPRRRNVVTFHDLFVLTGEYSTPEFRRRFAEQARIAARHADLILAVSAFTASQVAEFLAFPRARIRVVPHGIRFPLDRVLPDEERDNVVLFVGAIQKRKNTARLVHAFAAVDPSWQLVLVGSAGYEAEETLRAIEASPARDRIRLPGYVDTVELERLYNRSKVFAFPSLDEGFGIPVVEAMARGAAVVTSKTSALPEVAGDAGLLVDPTRTESIAEALRSVTLEKELRSRLVAQGLTRARCFTWERAVEATWSAYQELR